VVFAITLAEDGLIGAIGLMIQAAFARAEMGYWMGVPYWSNGYTTEAAAEVARYGFEELGLNRIHACYVTHNPASGRVMQKLGCFHIKRLRRL
jgi:[ribosomal protein S5]-alanine N-acetyltransferase